MESILNPLKNWDQFIRGDYVTGTELFISRKHMYQEQPEDTNLLSFPKSKLALKDTISEHSHTSTQLLFVSITIPPKTPTSKICGSMPEEFYHHPASNPQKIVNKKLLRFSLHNYALKLFS